MKEEASIRRKIAALATGLMMLLTVFAPVSAVSAAEQSADLQNGQTEQTEPESGIAAVPVSSVVLDKSTVSLKAGKSISLKAAVFPADASAKEVTWTSSDPSVAVVNANGKVTAKTAGKTVITAAAGGKMAACSIIVSLKTPAKVKAKSVGLKTIKVTWKKVSGAEGYQIYRAVSEKGSYKKIAVVKGGDKTSYKNTKRKTGKLYYYKVRAYSGKNYSAFSKVDKAEARPGKPTVKLKTGEEKIRISWKKVKYAQGYHIYRTTSKNGKYHLIKVVDSAKTTSYIDQGLKGGKKYYYKVKSYRKVDGQKVRSYSSKAAAAKAKKVKLKTSKHGFQYKRKMLVKAYAYSGGGRTAMGTRARVGAIAVDPRQIPLGTKVYVKGYGHARAEDTGGNIKGKTIDLYMNSNSACMRWGVRYVTVYLDVRK